MKLNRRNFLAVSAGAAIGSAASLQAPAEEMVNGVPRRVLGRTGEKVSLLTLGGYHMGVPGLSEQDAVRLVRTAVDEGINFLDNAWMYHDGRSETLMGKALKDGYRDKVYLMTKSEARTVAGIEEEFTTSLRRFDLDNVDLFQFHGIAKQSDIEAVYKAGLIEWAEKKRDAGLLRHIGFTGHSSPALHAEMITRGYDWDTVQMPVNVLDYAKEQSYAKQVMELAKARNIGVIAMKTNAGGQVARSGAAKPTESLRFAMGFPVGTAVSGMDSLDVLKENLELVRNFKPYTESEQKELVARCMPAARDGRFELYRMAGYRDGDAYQASMRTV